MSDAASIAREFLDSWNRRDFARMRALLHPDYSYTGADGQRQNGAEAGLAVAQMFADALPDGKIEILRIHTAGSDVAIVEFIGRGTQTGELMGVAPTGRQLTIPVCNIIETRDGKIYAEREYMDALNIMQQLGAAPVPATA
jgi:steroid delta-isomerase-like uncharacterized protein